MDGVVTANYYLSDPFFVFGIGSEPGNETITLTATSTVGTNTRVCPLALNSTILEYT